MSNKLKNQSKNINEIYIDIIFKIIKIIILLFGYKNINYNFKFQINDLLYNKKKFKFNN